MTDRTTPLHTAVIGGGSIGIGFAVVFARAGFTVAVMDPDPIRREIIPSEFAAKLRTLASHGLLQESLEVLEARFAVHGDLAEAALGAQLIQECVPERVELKQALFASLAGLTDEKCIIASSSSFMPTSVSAKDTGVEQRILVAHPGNPPYAIPVIELVPNQLTDPAIVQRAHYIYTQAGMSPVMVNKEIEGFVFNRLQGALLREAYALVRDGAASVDDIDTVVRDGLGRRWTFMGPFETADLNTRGGIASHAEKMGPSYHRMGGERGDTSEWTPELIAQVEAERRAMLPSDQWDDRTAWRDDQLLRRLAAAEANKSVL
ncbi:3-hydroxyacyl-CoA dehydrogenase [Nesterenkonia muleiensis]|uniref:3-hydroxyacyl-CoA dehydrogenase n=1 Tax=Nesterenkonia muleiensis TaxID=2282648 RepID=UPI000E73E04E|nr:3-hydroxyacyl-CoA dehydrogenase [Nesterenkonia muleiensis]